MECFENILDVFSRSFSVVAVQWLKGKTAHKIMLEFPHIKKHYWGQHMWARGYFCCSTGNVTDEIIAEYIANQQDDRNDDFKVDG